MQEITANQTQHDINELRVQTLLDKILKCDAAKRLYDQANAVKNKEGEAKPWKIESIKTVGLKHGDPRLMDFYNRKDYKFYLPTGSEACCSGNRRTLYISEDYSEKQALGAIVFELTNAVHTERFQLIHDRTLKGEVDCEDYVEQEETVEFEGTVMALAVAEEGIKNHNWVIETPDYGIKTVAEFKIAYHQTHKFNAHADYYRKSWERITKKKSEFLAKPQQKAAVQEPKELTPEEQEEKRIADAARARGDLIVRIFAVAYLVIVCIYYRDDLSKYL